MELTIEVPISNNHDPQAFPFPDFLTFIFQGELVPTRASPFFDNIHGISSTVRPEVNNCVSKKEFEGKRSAGYHVITLVFTRVPRRTHIDFNPFHRF